jgi:mono/diheme cytochrome c family protein
MTGTCRFLTALALLLAAALPAANPAAAQETRSVLDGVYTEAQAERGQRIYEQECSLCHGPQEFSGPAFLLTWNGQPVGALFMHIRMTMPQDNPGHLRVTEYADVIAYMLKLNTFPTGENELPSDVETLTRIRIDRPANPGRR